MQVEPGLRNGQRVRLLEDGIQSMCIGYIISSRFNPEQDRFEYLVDWITGEDSIYYPRNRLLVES